MLFKRIFIAFIFIFFVAPWVFQKTALATNDLHVAAKQGNIQKVKSLLGQGMDINLLSASGYTPLHLSAGWDKRRVTKLLVTNGAKINARNSSGSTPLHISAGRGHLKMVKFLLSQGANPEIRDRSGRTPADIARQYNVNDKIVDLLESTPKKNRAKEIGFFESIHESGIAYVVFGTIGALWLALELIPNIGF
jgi:ankyrin repeat protein